MNGTLASQAHRVARGALAAALVVGLFPANAFASTSRHEAPVRTVKNVIVLISDGMGYNELSAANLYSDGKLVSQGYEKFPVRKAMSTFAHPSVGGGYDPAQAWATFDYVKANPTDSAAAATAMSTGTKSYNAAIGVDVNGNKLKHALEYAEERGKATGVVSTVEFSHATPAGFVAHNPSRNDYVGIANEMLKFSAVDVIMGAGNPNFDDSGAARTPVASNYNYVGGQATWDALNAGLVGSDADRDGDQDAFKLIQTKADFDALTTGATPRRVVGVPQAYTTLQQNRGGDKAAAAFTVPFNTNVPTLATMTKGALNVLDNDRDGLFLMVEGGAVDWAGHANQQGRVIEEQEDFNTAVETVVNWVNTKSSWSETLVIVTGDHETGYLTGPGSGQFAAGPLWTTLVNNGISIMPGMQFNSTDHTNALIPLFARGTSSGKLAASAIGSDSVRGAYLDNTDIAKTIIASMR
ncbi:MAG: alkaline phosphatase [Coriobacteriia bacterium]|nr:alkaline phosphatase [Coriobacteriia bacterium]